MARILVYSGAHSGDVLPYVPVATELSNRGHDVTYVVPREFHPYFEAEPFRCVHSGTDFGPKGERGLFLLSSAAADIGPPHGAWPFVPLQPLLSRVKAVVQSGSHGTNALTLGAGLPSVLHPCLFDQQWHARRQTALGTGVWAKRARDLAPAVATVLGDPAYAERARAFGDLLATEDGVANAADQVEAFLAR